MNSQSQISSTQTKPLQQPLTRTLALDLGTKLGWAYGASNERPVFGTQLLQSSSQRKYESAGMKWLRLREWLNSFNGKVDAVVLESVARHIGTDAAHAYGGALAEVTAWCAQQQIDCSGVQVPTIKKFATGRGNADKKAMMEAAAALGFDVRDDNQADAIHLWRYATGGTK
jgi:Holliday junction resolvasome RuvABC endonuclease subunit